jgi:plasmid stabilization system protein ParE
MKARWSGAANRDLNAIWDHLKNESPRAAIAMLRRIEAAARLLGERPHIGKRGRAPGTREFVVGRTPYIIFYEAREDGPYILHVRHGRQQWPPEQ